MKLLKATTEEVCEFNEVELLQMENDFLKDELELQDTIHSLELMETVLKCIEQEGEVSKSVEIMFGDSVENKASFKEELEVAYEVFIKDKFDLNFETDKLVKVANMLQNKRKQAKAYLDENFNRIEYPVTCKMFKGGPTLLRYINDQLYVLIEKMNSKDVNSMTKEECRECILDFINLGRDVTKDFKDKYNDKIVIEKESIKNKEDAYRFAENDTKDVTKEIYIVIDNLKGLIQKFRRIAEKAETNSTDKYVAQLARGFFFMVRQEGYAHLQCVSSLYANMKAQTKA